MEKRRIRSFGVVVVGVAMVALVFQLATAGSLAPVAAPAGTLKTIAEIYDALVGSFDAQDVVAKKDHSALNWAKCVIGRAKGFDRCEFDFDKAPTPVCQGAVSVAFDASQNASISWLDFIASDYPMGVAASEFAISFAPTLFASSQYYDFVVNLGCSYEGANLASATACNGSACDFCTTTVTVNDPLTVCP